MNNVNTLIIGSGGREHAIAYKISQSKLLKKLYVAPGNAGTSEIATNLNINIDNYTEIKNTIISKNIDLLIIGPEDPLVSGLHDQLYDDKDIQNLQIIGPKKEGAQLEGSKFFAKKFMNKYNIPTASFKSFEKKDFIDAIAYLKSSSPPYVIKADGLAAGKGVFICNSLEQAENAVNEIIIKSKFGNAGKKIVIESFLDGIELSVFILTDGHNYKLLPSAKDYKRIGENDTGLNTGGMGAISPVPFLNDHLMLKIKNKIIEPTLLGLKNEKIEYSGFIFFGLINVRGEPYVIEYNVRLGDPETQTILPRIKSDFLKLLIDINKKDDFKKNQLIIDTEAAATVILTSGGYPENYEKGAQVKGIKDIESALLFHAGLKKENNEYYTNGGRVIAITGQGKNLPQALKLSYKNIKKINFNNAYYRKDIGFDVI